MVVGSFADIVAAAAGLGTFVIALIAVMLASRQIRTAREIEALAAYERYHHLVLEYPDLGTGDFDYLKASGPSKRRYEVFAMSVLLTIERVLALFPNDPNWRKALEDDLLLHKSFLCSPEFGSFVQNLEPAVADFVTLTAAKFCWDYPHAKKSEAAIARTQAPPQPAKVGA